MQEKTKNKLLIAIAIITTVLSVFNLGLMFGQVAYADDTEVVEEIPADLKIADDACNWYMFDWWKSELEEKQLYNENNSVVFFNTVNYVLQTDGKWTHNTASYYFRLEEATMIENGSEITFNAIGEYFTVYWTIQYGAIGSESDKETVDTTSYLKGRQLIYDMANNTFKLILTTGPHYRKDFNNVDGTFIGVRNIYTNILELDTTVNVITTITPNLSGTVDLNRTIDGTTYKGSSFKIRFENHSSFPVQVRWYARRTGLGRLSTDNLFQYGNLNIKNDCAAMIFQHGNVYTKNMNSQTWFDSNLTMTQMKNSEWFSLGTNENNNYKEIEISYTSTSFQPNVSYTWYTEALRIGTYGSVYEVFYSGSTGENPYPKNHAVDIDGLTLCQSDTFQFTSQYTYTYQSSGVGSDASCVGSDEDYLINTYSSSGRSDTVGSEGGDSSYKNLYLDKTSWLHEYSNEKWTNSGGSEYTDVLLRDANGFTSFIKSAFNIFPPEVNAVIVFTFIAVGFVIILKFVRG